MWDDPMACRINKILLKIGSTLKQFPKVRHAYYAHEKQYNKRVVHFLSWWKTTSTRAGGGEGVGMTQSISVAIRSRPVGLGQPPLEAYLSK